MAFEVLPKKRGVGRMCVCGFSVLSEKLADLYLQEEAECPKNAMPTGWVT